jgi:hypothetical protein
MTSDIKQLESLHSWISKRIVRTGIKGDKTSYDKYVRMRKLLSQQIDKHNFRELQKIY